MKWEPVSRRGREVTRGERRKQEPEKDGVHKKPGRETPFPREPFPYIGFDMETLRISPPTTGRGVGVGDTAWAPGGGAGSKGRRRQLPPGSAGASFFCLDWHLGMY